jgi:elongation factor Ts
MNTELVKQLRTKTAASMADCVSALNAAGEDFEKAVDIIKVKGQLIADAKSTKVAAEGILALKAVSIPGHRFVVLVEVNSQTDFCARNPDFIQFANDTAAKIAETVELNKPFTIDMVEEARKELVGKIKENVVVRNWWIQEAIDPKAHVFSYLHPNAKLGVLLALQAPNEEMLAEKSFIELGNDIAMQIAGMSPISISSDRLSTIEIDRQKAIFDAQVKEMGKNETQSAKIVEGKMRKWFSDVCLIEQESVIHAKKTIKSLLGDVKVSDFNRAVVGAGLEVQKTDLAEEVAKTIG